MKLIIDATCTYKNPDEQELKIEPFEIESDATDGFKNEDNFNRALKGIRTKLVRLVAPTIGHKRISSESAWGCFDASCSSEQNGVDQTPEIIRKQWGDRPMKTEVCQSWFFLVCSTDYGTETAFYVQMNLRQSDVPGKV